MLLTQCSWYLHVRVCMLRDRHHVMPQTPRGSARLLGCSSTLCMYMFVLVCVCVRPCIMFEWTYSITAKNIPSSSSVGYMYATLYAIWFLGVSFFSICSSHLWQKADPLGWVGSKVIWLRIHQLGIHIYVCAADADFILRHWKLCVGIVGFECGWTGVAVLFHPLWVRRLTHAITEQPHASGLCVIVSVSGVFHFQRLQALTVCLFIFLFVFMSCLPVYPSALL